MMKRVCALVVCICAAFIPALADEVDNGFYIGASIGQAKTDIDDDNFEFEDDDTCWKATMGWRIINYLGVEASWIDFGTVSDENLGVEVDSDGVDIAAVGYVPLGKSFELMGKFGYIAWDAEFDSDDVNLDTKDDGSDILWGVGAAWRFPRNFAIRLEYEDFDIEDVENMEVISAGLSFTF